MNKSEGLARWLIQHAARAAPPSLAERLEEEWLADLDARQGFIARLRLAAGCCWATRVIAYEHGGAKVPAAAAATTGSRTMSAYAQHQDPYFSPRSVAIVLIIVLHVGIVYAFMTGLVPKAYAKLTQPMNVVPIAETPRRNDPPPLQTVNPSLRMNPLNIPTPEFKFEDRAADVKEALVMQPDPPTGTGSASIPVPPVQQVTGGIGKGFPNPDDFYPAEAARNGQEGATVVQACVDRSGRLTAAPAVTRSSGTASLDAGALRLARAGSGHYRPSTANGQPVDSCFELRFTFHMRKGAY